MLDGLGARLARLWASPPPGPQAGSGGPQAPGATSGGSGPLGAGSGPLTGASAPSASAHPSLPWADPGDRHLGAGPWDLATRVAALHAALDEALPFDTAPDDEGPFDFHTLAFAESLGALPLTTQVELDKVLTAIAFSNLPEALQQGAFRDVARLAYQARSDVHEGPGALVQREQISALATFTEADASSPLALHLLLAQLSHVG